MKRKTLSVLALTLAALTAGAYVDETDTVTAEGRGNQSATNTQTTTCNQPMKSPCSAPAGLSGHAADGLLTTPGNPYLPLWEHIPDGEPYVFEDPDHPGQYRVYIYGSHDSMVSNYCGRELVVWSASVDTLTRWRYDGEIFSVKHNAQGQLLDRDGLADVLYAPDVALVTAPNGEKTYYLYPNNQAGGRNGMVCRSKRPDGPFEVCNWSTRNPYVTDGVLRFDPAVFVDDDGRVYGYWGFERSYAAELDPATMATVKPGTEVVEDMVSGRYQDGPFRFFEASSIRKIKDKYVFIYSRFTRDGEFGLPESNYTLAYAYSDRPLGPFTYGGTIIDGRARGVDEQGRPIATATVDGNTHGSICQIGGQWYVFYHRQTGTDEYARQAMVAPIEVTVEEGIGGKVTISEGEYTSEGFSLQGLQPLERHSAGIACWYTGPKTAIHEWPNNTFFGSYVASAYGDENRFSAPYAFPSNSNPVVNNTSGSIVGYKYFNFSGLDHSTLTLQLGLVPQGVEGTLRVMIDSPWPSQGGVQLGQYHFAADMPQQLTEVSIPLQQLPAPSKAVAHPTNGQKRAIFFTFTSATPEQSLCTLHDFRFAVNPPLVYTVENTGKDCPAIPLPSADQLPVQRQLPDVFAWSGGEGRVSTFDQWAQRRSEISQQIQHYGIGTKPAVPAQAVKARMEGDTLLVDVTVGGQTLQLTSTIRYPKTGQPPYALMIGTSMLSLPRQLFDDKPIAIMTFHEKQVNDYGQFGNHHERGQHPFDRLYPSLTDNGAYSMWAWGLSRLIDGLQQLGPDVTRIDTEHIGVSGCSYAGKMALYCGALDERVALTIAQEPGGGGAAAWRTSYELTDTVETLDRTDYHWFKESQRQQFGGDNVYRLPYDQHELCALVCPRALLLLGNPDYKWLADASMLVSAQAAQQVWQHFGIADRFGYSIVGGHGHCQLPPSQYPEVEAFIDRFLLGRDVDTGHVEVVSGLGTSNE